MMLSVLPRPVLLVLSSTPRSFSIGFLVGFAASLETIAPAAMMKARSKMAPAEFGVAFSDA
jgi:hypothetical protein